MAATFPLKNEATSAIRQVARASGSELSSNLNVTNGFRESIRERDDFVMGKIRFGISKAVCKIFQLLICVLMILLNSDTEHLMSAFAKTR